MSEEQRIRPAARMIRIADEGANRPSPANLKFMRSKGGRWAAYQNHDMGNLELGRLCFLSYGSPHSTFVVPPPRYPDVPSVGTSGWRYIHVGFVNLETGEVTDKEPE